MCIEREKDNFKSREVNCLKECALALTPYQRLRQAILRRPILVAFYDTHGDTEDTFST